jgi:hypothetical protein
MSLLDGPLQFSRGAPKPSQVTSKRRIQALTDYSMNALPNQSESLHPPGGGAICPPMAFTRAVNMRRLCSRWRLTVLACGKFTSESSHAVDTARIKRVLFPFALKRAGL